MRTELNPASFSKRKCLAWNRACVARAPDRIVAEDVHAAPQFSVLLEGVRGAGWAWPTGAASMRSAASSSVGLLSGSRVIPFMPAKLPNQARRFEGLILQPRLIRFPHFPLCLSSARYVFAHSVRPFRRHLRHGHGFGRRGDAGKGRQGHRLGPERLSAHVHLPGGPQDRGHLRLRGAEPGAQARPGRHRQRHLPRQPGSRVRAGPQAALLLAAGAAEGVLHSRQALAGRHRHARQDHHDRAADVGLRAQRPEPELPHRRHPEQPRPGRALHRQRMVHHRRRRIRHRLLRQAQQVRALPARGGASSTTSSSTTPTSSRAWSPSRPPSSTSSGSSRATACCWPTATTRTWRRCST